MTSAATTPTAGVAQRAAGAVTPAPAVSLPAALAAVYSGQLARARVARASLLFVATLQSIGILVLLRGVVDTHNELTKQSVVAGSTVLVVAFVALNLLAQRFGALRASRALDYYAALPAPPAAVVLATAAAYATFTVPGAVVTALVGAAIYGLPIVHLWLLIAVLPAAGAALAGLGALLGLAMPKPELATVAGQLGMTVVMFLGIIPADRLPFVVRVVRAFVPSTYGVDALAEALRAQPDWASVAWHLAVCVAVGVVALGLATRVFRWAVSR